MRILILILFCLFIFPVSKSIAADPPGGGMTVVTSITLTYNLDQASLHVEAVHPSDDLEKNYVRMMEVSLNGQLVSTLNYDRQQTFAGFSDDVSLKAQVGDVITVTLFCSGGSSSSQDLTVKKPDTSQPDQSVDAGADNSAADNGATDNSTTNNSVTNTAN